MTAVLIIPLAFASASQGTWLAYAFGTVMLLFVVFCLNQFAKRSAFAGSMYALHGQGPRAQRRSVLRLDAHLVVLLHRRGRDVRIRRVLRPVAFGARATTDRYTRSSSSRSAQWPAGSSRTRTSGSLPSSPWSSSAASVACITALALRDPVQARFSRRHQAADAERGERQRHGPRRRGLHLLAGRFRGARRPWAPKRRTPGAIFPGP